MNGSGVVSAVKARRLGILRVIQSALRAHSSSVLVKDAACDIIEFIMSREDKAIAVEALRLGTLVDVQAVMRVHLYHENVHNLACFAPGLGAQNVEWHARARRLGNLADVQASMR
jgi:hypothetical protein